MNLIVKGAGLSLITLVFKDASALTFSNQLWVVMRDYWLEQHFSINKLWFWSDRYESSLICVVDNPHTFIDQ